MHQNHIFRSFAPDTSGRAYSTPPEPLVDGKVGLLPLPKNLTPSPLSALEPQTNSAFRASFHNSPSGLARPPFTGWNLDVKNVQIKIKKR